MFRPKMYVLKLCFFEASLVNAVLPLKTFPDSNSKQQENVPNMPHLMKTENRSSYQPMCHFCFILTPYFVTHIHLLISQHEKDLFSIFLF